MKTQLRFVNEAPPVVDGGKIRGVASVFNKMSNDLGGYREIIRPGAFDRSLREIAEGKRQVDARIQHEGGLLVCGSTANGTLILSKRADGLHYELVPPDTQSGRDLVTMVRDGYLRHSSFAFECRNDQIKWDWSQNPPVVEVLDLDLVDVAPCSRPAYDETTVAVRSMMGSRPTALPAAGTRREWGTVNAKQDGGRKVVEFHLFDEVLPGWMGKYMPDLTTAASISRQLVEHYDADRIDLFINSPGGDVFEGLTIYNVLRDHPAPVHVYVQGLAASIAGIIAMAGDHIQMGMGSMLMVHRAWTMAAGNVNDMRDTARLLDKIDSSLAGVLAGRSGNDAKRVEKWMDDETWFTAEEAVANGFADRVSAGGEYANALASHSNNCRSLGYRNIPGHMGGPDTARSKVRAEYKGSLLADLRVANARALTNRK